MGIALVWLMRGFKRRVVGGTIGIAQMVLGVGFMRVR